MSAGNGAMTKTDRKQLATLVRKRAKVAVARAAQRKAELKAQFEEQLAAIYTPDDDEAMKAIHSTADGVVEEAKVQLAERCQELGIPARFAPRLNLFWHGRGENALASRRAELRKVCYTRLDALEKEARTEIEASSVEIQTQLIAGGLDSEAAREFLASMPTPEELMPAVGLEEVRAQLQGRAGA